MDQGAWQPVVPGQVGHARAESLLTSTPILLQVRRRITLPNAARQIVLLLPTLVVVVVLPLHNRLLLSTRRL